MTALLVAGWLLAAGSAGAAAPAPEDLYREANAAFEAGDLETAAAKLQPFQAKYSSHRLAWPANLLWARCTTEPEEAERRFRKLAGTAPPETRKECELEVARLLVLRDRYEDAERAYAAFLESNPEDERAEEASYWRAACLKALGREAEAGSIAEAELRKGRQDRWRALSGILLGTIKYAKGDSAGAHALFTEIAAAPWGADVRPQALLGAAKSVKDPDEVRRLCNAVIKGYPDSPEADEARRLINASPEAGARFGVQVGAFAQPGNAAAERKKWTKRGKKVVVLKRKHESFGELFFVLLGPYPTREQADLVAKELKGEGVSCRVSAY